MTKQQLTTEADVLELIEREVDYNVECRGYALNHGRTLTDRGQYVDLLITRSADSDPTLHFKFTDGAEFVVAVRRLS